MTNGTEGMPDLLSALLGQWAEPEPSSMSEVKAERATDVEIKYRYIKFWMAETA